MTTTHSPENPLHDLSARNLQNARERAPKYSSQTTRNQIVSAVAGCGVGFTPYSWQLDVAEALLLGVDCSVIAGTGAGKTLPFVLPLLVDTGKIIIVISPLNALEEDQAARFNKMGLRALAVNGETYNSTIHAAIEKREYNVIITSPEMCLQHDQFRRLLSSTKFAQHICALVIDEAHCISQWGSGFRPEYAELGTLRAFVPASVPCLVASATMPPPVLTQVRAVMHIQEATSYHVNLGTDRPNIAWFVRQMAGAKSDLESLSFLIPKENEELVPTMVFFDDINQSMAACKWLKERIPEHLRHQVDFYNSHRASSSKKIVLRDFRQNKIKILFTTEAAGMGCDIPHIEQVVQFMVPSSLTIWSQRAGRGGRSRLINARAILLVQPSVFQEVKQSEASIAKSGPRSDGKNYRKNIEEGLRMWIETDDCRRDASSRYFGDQLMRKAPTDICCDNCLRKAGLSHPLLAPTNVDASSDDSLPAGLVMSIAEAPVCLTTVGYFQIAANRRDQYFEGAVALLTAWRRRTWRSLYLRRPWGQKGLLPDAIITALATKTCHATSSAEEVALSIGWNRLHCIRHCGEITTALAHYDRTHYDNQVLEKRARTQEKKKATLERAKAKRAADKIAKQNAKALQPQTPRPRPSRAKPKSGPSIHRTPLMPLHPYPHANLPYLTPAPGAPIPVPHSPYVSSIDKENMPLRPQVLFNHNPVALPDPPFFVPSH